MLDATALDADQSLVHACLERDSSAEDDLSCKPNEGPGQQQKLGRRMEGMSETERALRTEMDGRPLYNSTDLAPSVKAIT